jgi:hypothetical protein
MHSRRFRPAVTVLEDRATPATHTWTGAGATDNWSDAGNWSGGVPTSGEPGGTVVVFDTVVSTRGTPASVQDIPGLVLDQLRFDPGSRVSVSVVANLGISGQTLTDNVVSASRGNTIIGTEALTLLGAVRFDVASGEADLRVEVEIDGSGTLVKAGAGMMSIVPENSDAYTWLTRIDGGTLLLGTLGLPNSVPFSRTDSTLLGNGSEGNDTYFFGPAAGYYNVSVNGVLLRFDSSAANVVVLRGNSGADTVNLYPTGSGNVVGLADTYGVLQGGTGYQVYVGNGVETVAVTNYQPAPGNTAYLAGSDANDVFAATPAYAVMAGDGFYNAVAGFETVGAFGNGGVDTAYLTGSAGADGFVGTNTYAGMVGGGYANYVAGFEGVVADAGGGSDDAYLADSAGDDVIAAAGTRATLSLPTVAINAEGFDGVVAYGFNGGVNRKRVEQQLSFVLDLPGVWVD